MSEETCDRCQVSVADGGCGVFCPACDDALRVAEAECSRLRLQLDSVEGAATGQPGDDPTPQDRGWSTALAAVKAVVAERDRLRVALRRIARSGFDPDGIACEALGEVGP